jgi:transcriptional regulator GlxA family with amidase domain
MRKVVIVGFPGVQVLDVTGPGEVFSMADRLAEGAYEVSVRARTAEPLATSGQLRVAPNGTLPRRGSCPVAWGPGRRARTRS